MAVTPDADERKHLAAVLRGGQAPADDWMAALEKGDVDALAGLTEGPDGHLYGTTIRGGLHDVGTVYRLSPQGVHTVIYSFTPSPLDGQNPASGLELAHLLEQGAAVTG